MTGYKTCDLPIRYLKKENYHVYYLLQEIMEVSLMEDDFDNEESLDLNDIFTDEFMSEYTDFESFGEFLAEAPVRIEDQDDFDNMDMSEMDAFVAEVTKFEAWEDMQGEAVSLYTINQLGL